MIEVRIARDVTAAGLDGVRWVLLDGDEGAGPLAVEPPAGAVHALRSAAAQATDLRSPLDPLRPQPVRAMAVALERPPFSERAETLEPSQPLHRASSDQAAEPPPLTTAAQAARPGRRWLAAALAVLLMALAGGGWWWQQRQGVAGAPRASALAARSAVALPHAARSGGHASAVPQARHAPGAVR